MRPQSKGRITKFDVNTIAGVAIAGVAMAGGFILERGRLGDLGSLNAGLLVFGGTLGAVLMGTPHSILASSLRRCRSLFHRESGNSAAVAKHILKCSAVVRRLGLASIEPEAEAMEEGLLRRGLLLVVDGVGAVEIRRQLQLDIAVEEEKAEADARVFEQAGGYAPTIGIIGAVLGLILVMKQLGNVDEVGRGIASAFTSTLYGVALANLVLLPLAARIRARARLEANAKELILEGAVGLAERLSPRVMRTRLEPFLNHGERLPANLAPSTVQPPNAARQTA